MSDTMTYRNPDPDLVICPNCVHQFRAIPENVQAEVLELRKRLSDAALVEAELREELAGAKLDAERYQRVKRELYFDPDNHVLRLRSDCRIRSLASRDYPQTMDEAIDAAIAQEGK